MPLRLNSWATRVVPVNRSTAVWASTALAIPASTGTRMRLEPRYLITRSMLEPCRAVAVHNASLAAFVGTARTRLPRCKIKRQPFMKQALARSRVAGARGGRRDGPEQFWFQQRPCAVAAEDDQAAPQAPARWWLV